MEDEDENESDDERGEDRMGLGERCALLFALPAVAGGLSVRAPLREIAAWVTYWDLENGISRLIESASPRPVGVHDAFLFVASLAPDGSVRLAGDERSTLSAVETLEGRGTRVWLTVVNDVLPSAAGAIPTLKDPALVHGLIADAGRSERHQEDLLALARRLGVSGIDIDYENLAFTDRAAFTRFIAGLSRRTRDQGLLLSVTVQPKTGDVRSAGAGAMDWNGLCPYVDRLQVMLYNLHSRTTGPGPIATPEWIETVLGYAATRCPTSRLAPAIKLSGMDWGPDGAVGIQYDAAVALAERLEVLVQRDGRGGPPHFEYESREGRHTVFFEDFESIQAKLETVEQLGFHRVILWSVGREDPSLLSRLLSGS